MAGDVVNIRVCSPLKLRSGLTGKNHAICHYPYNLPLCAINLAMQRQKNRRRKRKEKKMRKKLLVLVIGGLMIIPKLTFTETKESKFWKWFQKNEEMLFSFEADQENIFDKLQTQMNKVNGDLTFEFGPKDDNNEKREFVISAGGIKKSFSSVEKLYSEAPNLKHFHLTKFRPRRTPLNAINFGDIVVSPDSVTYQLFNDNDKIGIMLFISNYSNDENEKMIFSNIGYLLLDEALGEYDVEIKVGFIELSGTDSKYYEGAKPLVELPSDFDKEYEKKTRGRR